METQQDRDRKKAKAVARLIGSLRSLLAEIDLVEVPYDVEVAAEAARRALKAYDRGGA